MLGCKLGLGEGFSLSPRRRGALRRWSRCLFAIGILARGRVMGVRNGLASLHLTGYIAEYEDGSKHVFQVPQSTLEQGLPSEGRYSIACIVAYEWQQDGYLKPGKIARVYRDNSLPPLSGFHA